MTCTGFCVTRKSSWTLWPNVLFEPCLAANPPLKQFCSGNPEVILVLLLALIIKFYSITPLMFQLATQIVMGNVVILVELRNTNLQKEQQIETLQGMESSNLLSTIQSQVQVKRWWRIDLVCMMLNRLNYFWSYSLIIKGKNLHLIGQLIQTPWAGLK